MPHQIGPPYSLIPCWDSQRADPEEKRGSASGIPNGQHRRPKALDLRTSNREEPKVDPFHHSQKAIGSIGHFHPLVRGFYRSRRSFHPGCHHSTISESVSATLGGRS